MRKLIPAIRAAHIQVVIVTPGIPIVISDFDKMLELYPDWVNLGALWTWARSLKP